MARFRPSKLFRRISSRNDSNTHNTSPSPSRSSEVPSPALPVYSAHSPLRVRKSSSLPKLRKRSAAHQAAAPEVPDVPEVLKEPRESVYLSSVARTEDQSPGGRSGSETLGGEKEIEKVEVEEKTPRVSAEELRLDEIDSIPVVAIEQPTPDVVEEVTAVLPHGSPE